MRRAPGVATEKAVTPSQCPRGRVCTTDILIRSASLTGFIPTVFLAVCDQPREAGSLTKLTNLVIAGSHTNAAPPGPRRGYVG